MTEPFLRIPPQKHQGTDRRQAVPTSHFTPLLPFPPAPLSSPTVLADDVAFTPSTLWSVVAKLGHGGKRSQEYRSCAREEQSWCRSCSSSSHGPADTSSGPQTAGQPAIFFILEMTHPALKALSTPGLPVDTLTPPRPRHHRHGGSGNNDIIDNRLK